MTGKRNEVAAAQSVRVHPARRDEVGLVLALVQDLAEYERLRSDCVAREEDIAGSLFGPAPRVFCDIVEVDGSAAGLALWFYSYSTFRARHGIYLEDLFVRPEFRGRGAGRALLASLAQRAIREGCARFEWSVLDWNAPSIAFYESLGAKPVAGWTRYRLDGDALDQLGAE